jgi:hypothetical protein
LERDGVSEFMKFGHEAFGGAFGVAALEVVASEFAVGLAGGEHVPLSDQDRVFDGAERTAVADPWAQSLVLGLEVGVLGSGRGERGFFERDTEPFAAFAVRPLRRLPADLSLPGQPPAQLARCRAVGNTLMSIPISATMTSAVRRATPVRLLASSTPAAKGPSCSSIASESRPICSSRKSR